MHPLRQLIHQFVILTDQEWLLLYQHCEEITVAKHAYFIKEGKQEKRVGFMLEGTMRQFYTKATGEAITTYFYFENNLVSSYSYISCIHNVPSKITIEALQDCKLVVFNYSILLALFKQEKVWETFGRKMAEYLAAGLEERMVSLLIDKPEERYIKLLASSNKQKLLARIPQHYIANYLGITPISLSRIRGRLTKGI
jgi:CRP-like cAMP-binding protein